MKKRTKILLASFMLGSSITAGSVFADNHTVRSGETLWSISNKYNVSLTDLKLENKLTTNSIYIGQSIYIPGTLKEGEMYKVKSGDTLWEISRTYDVSISDLVKWNNLSGNIINVGQNLIVSEGKSTTPTSESKTNLDTYTVKSGDTLSKIASIYGLTVTELKNINNLSRDIIYIGQSLKITKAKAQQSIFTRPAEGVISSHFGNRNSSNHYGIDYAKTGTVSIKAAANGVVSKSYFSTSYGEVIFIVHEINGKTYETLYAHMKTNTRALKVGDKVKQGQHLGYMGNTGNSRGQHLHFEIHEGLWNANKTNAVDPIVYLPN